MDVAVQPPGQVYAQERESGIGDRVDEAVDEVGGSARHVQVLPSESQDPDVAGGSRPVGHAVCVQAGAPHQEAGIHGPVGGLHLPAFGAGCGPSGGGAGPDLAALSDDPASQSMGHAREVGSASGCHVDRRHARHVRFVFTGGVGDQVGDVHAVGPGPFGQGVQARSFRLRGGDHQLPAAVVGDAVLSAELDHPVPAPYGQVRLQ